MRFASNVIVCIAGKADNIIYVTTNISSNVFCVIW